LSANESVVAFMSIRVRRPRGILTRRPLDGRVKYYTDYSRITVW